ncbi:MAG: hypothetical protein IJ514_07195 [Clostridia bacterium]|nr:hypothetical protein [Clostridia bacterium]
MKNVNNTSASTLSKIHGIAFTVFFIIEQILSELVYPYLETVISKPLYIAISAVVAAVLYSALFFVVRAVYDFMLTRKDKRLQIDGLWYHVHIPHYMGKEDYSQVRLSVGTTTVSRDLLDFTFVGNNERCYMTDGKLDIRSENATHWYTKATKLSDENDFDIIEIYEAQTRGNPTISVESCPCCRTKFETPVELSEAERFRHGIHKIDVKQENGKTYLKGEYSDCWPSLKTGELFWYRTAEERDEKAREFFEAAEAWRKQNERA